MALAKLPAALRARVPKLVSGGSMYSSDPKARMVVINGKALHEGEEVAPGLLLQAIGEKSAVLEIDGQRFVWRY